jgi:hypothetical protein
MFGRTPITGGDPIVMAYPQSGQFPAYPQYPGQVGMPAKPPVPQTVQNAFYLMLAGAALQLVSGIAVLGSTSKIRDTVRSQHPDFTTTQVDNAVHAGVAIAIVGVLIGMGLWIWMAFANRAGKNWARITGTVFFGIDCLSLLVGLAASSSSTMNTTKDSGFSVAVGILIWIVGLVTVILLWNKQSSAYFKPGQYGPGGGVPQYPYPYGDPSQQPQPPYGAAPPQQPTDPWSNPPQQ